jgi:O-antigen/teichoic acid export membrane protein
MAKSSIIGSFLGLITTIPLYYWYGLKGIVPAIIIAAFTSLFLTWYFVSKINIKRVEVNLNDVKIEGKQMLIMGLMISLSGIITLAFSYFVRIFISNYGTINDVGLYNAGFTMINTYVGMIFTAMSADYYPKLCKVVHDIDKMNQTINQQAEIAVLILSPILLVFIVFINLAIKLLFSETFLPITLMILFAASGMLFKAVSWAIAHVILAKNSSKLFFWNELIANIYILGLNLAGYFKYGLTGLGISFFVGYFIYLVQIFIVTRGYYKYSISGELKWIFSINLSLILACLVVNVLFDPQYNYNIGLGLLVFSLIFNLNALNIRLNLTELIKQKLK